MNRGPFEYEDVRSFIIPKETPPFWVVTCGVSYCDKTYYMERVCSNVTVLEYVIKGTGAINVDDREYHAAAGDVCILNEYCKHSYRADENDPWVKIYINLKGFAVPEIIQAYGLHNQVVYPGCEELHTLFQRFFELTGQEMTVEEIMEQCNVLFIQILNRLSTMSFRRNSVSDEASQVKNFINSNYHRELTVGEIAQSIYRSNDYINKLFKRAYGITPYQYYIETRISHAKALLKYSALSIAEIAECLGYRSNQYFSKQFHKVTGMTASEYRANPVG